MFSFRMILFSEILLVEMGENCIASKTTKDPLEEGPTISLSIILHFDPVGIYIEDIELKFP